MAWHGIPAIEANMSVVCCDIGKSEMRHRLLLPFTVAALDVKNRLLIS